MSNTTLRDKIPEISQQILERETNKQQNVYKYTITFINLHSTVYI